MKPNRSLIIAGTAVILFAASIRLAMAACEYLSQGNSNGTPQKESLPDCVAIKYDPPYAVSCVSADGKIPGMDDCVPNLNEVYKITTTWTITKGGCAKPATKVQTDDLGYTCEQDYMNIDANPCNN
jgi:hypothetical protein